MIIIIHIEKYYVDDYNDVDHSHENDDANDWRLHKECKDDRSVSHLLNDNDDDLHHHDYQLSIINIMMI